MEIVQADCRSNITGVGNVRVRSVCCKCFFRNQRTSKVKASLLDRKLGSRGILLLSVMQTGIKMGVGLDWRVILYIFE